MTLLRSDLMHRIEDVASSGVPSRLIAAVKRSRALSGVAWRTLHIWQKVTRSAPDALRQLESMERAPSAGDGPRVLMFSLRGWTTHLAWETTLARALHVRGAETLTVLCDRALPACEPRTEGNDYASTCDRCVALSGGFLERTGLPYQWLSAYLDPRDHGTAAAAVADLPLDGLRAFEEDGVPIGRLVAASVNRHLLRGNGHEPTPMYVEAYRRFVAAGIVARRAGAKLLARFRPERIVVLNGLFYAEAILMYVARQEGIPVYAYERAKRLNSLIFARNEAVVRQSFDAKWAENRDRPLTAAQSSALDAYVASRFAGEVGIERLWAQQAGWEAPDDGRPMAALYTNVLWDTAMFDSDMAFGSMTEWIVHTIAWFARRPDRRLVIRVHPAEVRVPFKASRDRVVDRVAAAVATLPENVRVVGPEEPLDSYELLRRSSVVLTYASTIGLEAAVTRVPTVVAGRTHYRNRGFTLDPVNPAEYDLALEEAFRAGPLEDRRWELARRYAWLYFFEEIIPFPLVHEEPRSYVTFAYHSGAELAVGREAGLDSICNAVLMGGPVINPAA